MCQKYNKLLRITFKKQLNRKIICNIKYKFNLINYLVVNYLRLIIFIKCLKIVAEF